MRRTLIGAATVVAVLLAGCSTRSGDGPGTGRDTRTGRPGRPRPDGPPPLLAVALPDGSHPVRELNVGAARVG